MKDNISDIELLQAARCEDLKYNEIKDLTVLGEFEKDVVSKLKKSGSHLLQGARGVGKSMLMRQAEIELDDSFQQQRVLSVYISFKTSPLLEGIKIGDKDAFQVWVGAKILQGLYHKLLFMNLIQPESESNPYKKLFNIDTSNSIESYLTERIHKIQNTAINDKTDEIDNEFITKVNDISFIRDTIKEIITKLKIEKLIFLFDEVAHTFIPKQQEIFFEIFKLIHGDDIATKAAVYPTVTSYGKNFEIGQDAILIQMDRFETGKTGLNSLRVLFRDILEKRIGDNNQVKKRFFSKGDLLDQCIYSSSGNPRAFFHILLAAIDKGFNLYGVQSAIQGYVDQELIPYNRQVAKRLPRFANHSNIGFDLIKNYIMQEIKEKNHKEKKSGYQSAFFTLDRDASPNLKIALDLLCYSGILTKKGTVKIANKRTGQRYMINIALMITEKAFITNKISEAIKSLSVTDYREFSSSDPKILDYSEKIKHGGELCESCGTEVSLEAKFCSNCGTKISKRPIITKLLDDPIEYISIGWKIAKRVEEEFPKVGDLLQATRDDLLEINYVGPVKSRIIKNAVEEYVSG